MLLALPRQFAHQMITSALAPMSIRVEFVEN